MKLLMIIDGLGAGGVERRMISLVKYLTNHNTGYEISIIILSKKLHYVDIIDLPVSLYFIERKPKKDPRVFLKVFNICRKLKPDILHVWSSQSAMYALPAKIFLRIKFINSMIVNAPVRLSPKTWFRAKVSFPFSDYITSNSYAGLKSYKPPMNKSIVIHNGYNFNRIDNISDPAVTKRHFSIGNNVYVVGMVARFEKNKDHKTFLEAAEIVLKKRNDVVFVLVGDGTLLNYFREKYEKKYVNKIYFLGSQLNVENIINIFDIGVLATNTEGISNSIMEYMALKKPVIATEGGGTNEIIVNNDNGFLIPHGNVSILAEKIIYLLNDSNVRLSMGDHGKDLILKKFNINSMVTKFIELYEKVLR